MLPLLACGLGVLALCITSVERTLRARSLAVAVAWAALLAAPLFTPMKHEHGVPQAIAFITRRFWPEGHDDAARLRAALRARPSPSPEDLARLAALYRAEGRDNEAKRALQGKL